MQLIHASHNETVGACSLLAQCHRYASHAAGRILMVTLHWLNASGSLASCREGIEANIDLAISRIATQLTLPDIDVLVQRTTFEVIKEMGFSGRAWGPHLMSFYLDTDSPNLQSSLARYDLARQFAHEAHHCLRMAGTGYGFSLGEALVSEGLAGHFASMTFGSPPGIWECAVGKERLKNLPLSDELLRSQSYNHAEWFFGQGDHPQWLGYSLGWHLVDAWLQAGSRSLDERINVEADDVLAFLPTVID
ncbi:DUF2268 domain-containing putative Zn-dependent protease [Pantoea sp. SJZ147]|uniref:DUF2268 domain-containing putative Zn-dependent protease n=1 Tax=Pantoea sp. SJZ147 TaxID=2572896 RepID=UPI00119DB4D8|nr:DUF2268 domain-containing putative Zn-dependent protease [Pantoea sp. SJZ147]